MVPASVPEPVELMGTAPIGSVYRENVLLSILWANCSPLIAVQPVPVAPLMLIHAPACALPQVGAVAPDPQLISSKLFAVEVQTTGFALVQPEIVTLQVVSEPFLYSPSEDRETNGPPPAI